MLFIVPISQFVIISLSLGEIFSDTKLSLCSLQFNLFYVLDRMSFEYKNTPDKLASVLGSIILLLTAFINLKPNVRRVAYTLCYPDTLYGPVSYRHI